MFRGTDQRSLEIGYLMELSDEVSGSMQNIHGFIGTCKAPLVKVWSIKQNYWELNMHMHIYVCLFGCSVVFDFLWPHGLQLARVLCPWGIWGKNTGVDIPFSRGSFSPRDQTQVACIGRWALNYLSHQCVCVCVSTCILERIWTFWLTIFNSEIQCKAFFFFFFCNWACNNQGTQKRMIASDGEKVKDKLETMRFK